MLIIDEKAPEIPKEEETIADESEGAEVDKLVEPAGSQSHYIVCLDHFMLYEEDDYSREDDENSYFDAGEAGVFRALDQNARGRRQNIGGNKQAAAPAKQPSEAAMNDLIMKSLKTILAQQDGGGGAGARNGNTRGGCNSKQ